jgi:Kef-type K+ transport system membrane component KefB
MMFAKQELATVDGFLAGQAQYVRTGIERVHNIAKQLTGIGLGLALGVIFVSIGFNVFFNTNTTGWDATTKLIWGYIPWVASAVVIAILGVAAYAHGQEY